MIDSVVSGWLRLLEEIRTSRNAISAKHVRWAYRLLLDREPERGDATRISARYGSTKELRGEILRSAEYALKNGGGSTYRESLNVFADLSIYGIQGILYVNMSDYIGLSVAKGAYELEEVALVKSKVKPGHTVVDIGGNIGFFSVMFSHLVGGDGRVFTFEPVPGTLEYLERSVSANSFCSNVTVFQAIVTDSASNEIEIAFQPLEEGSGSTGGSHLVRKDEHLPPHMRRLPIKADCLDAMIPEREKIDFIKIDVEGAELLAMRGAPRILTTQSPFIMSEVHPEQLRRVSKVGWRDYFNLMSGYGYAPHFFRGGTLAEMACNLEDDKVYNVAFVKRSDARNA